MIDYSIRFFGLLKSLLICKFVILQIIARIDFTGVFWSLNVPNFLLSVKNRELREICFPQKHNKSYQNNFQFGLMTNNFSQQFITCAVATSNDDGWFTNTPSPHWSRIESLYGKTLRSSIFFSKLMTRDWFLDPVIFCVFWEGLKRSLASPNLIWIDEDEKNFSVINIFMTLSKQVHGHNVDKHSVIHYSKVPNSKGVWIKGGGIFTKYNKRGLNKEGGWNHLKVSFPST